MANKKVSQLTSKPSVLTTDLFPIADPSTGQLYKTTISDLGTAIGSGVSSVNSLVGAVVLDTDDIQELVSPTNKWFTDTRARAALSASSPLTYNSGTGAFGIQVANGSQNGYLSSTDWTTFNNKLSTATAASTYVPYTGATANVDLGLNYSLTAASIIKSGGTSTQFLKADGSIDTNTYLTTSAAASTYVSGSGVTDYYARFTGAKVIADGFIRTTSNITYVEGMGLSTGNGLDIQGNYGAGGGGLKIRSYDETTGNAYIDFANTGGRMYLGLNRSTASGLMTNATAYATVLTTGLGTSNLEFGTNATKRMTIDGTTGAVTLTSALSGTSATFSAGVVSQGAYTGFQYNSAGTYPAYNTYFGAIGTNFSNSNSELDIWNTVGGGFVFRRQTGASAQTALLTLASSGAATFSSSVTATQLYADTSSSVVGGFNSTNANGGYLTWATSGTIIADIGTLQQIFGSGGSTNFGINARGTKDLAFGTNNTERLRITSSGNVGIGTTSPTNFQPFGYGANIEASGGRGGGFVSSDSTSTVKMVMSVDGSGGVYGMLKTLTNHPLMFATNDTERMRITSAGNVGIGTSVISQNFSGYTHLDIGNATTGGILLFSNASGTNYGYINGEAGGVNMRATVGNLTFNTGSSERMRITGGGSVLIGTTSSLGFAMEVNGSIWAQKLRINDTASGYVTLEMENTTRWRINYLGRFSGYGAGTLTTDASGNISASSDKSLKDVIKPIENVLENIKDFEPVYFKWNDKTDLDKENVYMSTIAQSIQKHYPDAVGKMADGTLTVQDRAVTAILVQAIKELKAELDTLKNK